MQEWWGFVSVKEALERVAVTRYHIQNSGVHQQSIPEFFHGIPETEYATYVKTVQIQKIFAPFLQNFELHMSYTQQIIANYFF